MSEKIKISLDDPEVREVWNTALEARREVASWPAWKGGEEAIVVTTATSTDDGTAGTPAPGPKR
jgi:hypothetical protein